MGQVQGQVARDVAIYRAWVDGARQDDLAARYGVDQSNISRAIGRVLAAFPEPDKAAEVRRSVDLCDDLLAVYVPKARAGNPSASREARGWLQQKARWLGIDRREVQVDGHVQVEHTYRGPTTEEILSRWLAEGRLRPRAELTRLDPGPGS